MKIKSIEVKNFKALTEKYADFNGCSAIITGSNELGKTSFLSGLIDRMRGIKPGIILKEGQEKGHNVIELTDGCKIEWRFTGKTENFSFTTTKGFKQTTGVLKQVGERYFGTKFDIDKFLLSSSREQAKKLADLVGLDFTEIDAEHKAKYEERTVANREVTRLRNNPKTKPVKIEKPDLDGLKAEKQKITEANNKMLAVWEDENKKNLKEIEDFNKKQDEAEDLYQQSKKDWDTLRSLEKTALAGFIDYAKAEEYTFSIKRGESKKIATSLPMPETLSFAEIDEKIQKANDELLVFDRYERDLAEYEKWVKDGKNAVEHANNLDNELKEIEARKMEQIASANFPEGFEFTEEGVNYNGYPLRSSQISKSGMYIAALKLGAMVLGEVRSMHFDASPLDKNSLMKVYEWAEKNDLQILIERPAFDGGEIRYKILTDEENTQLTVSE